MEWVTVVQDQDDGESECMGGRMIGRESERKTDDEKERGARWRGGWRERELGR